MSKLAHSNAETMAQIERDAARDNGELRRCTVCEAENCLDDPDCPRDASSCNIVTVAPQVAPEPDFDDGPAQTYVKGFGWMRAEHAVMLEEARRTGIVPAEIQGPLSYLRDAFLTAAAGGVERDWDNEPSGISDISNGELGA